MVLTQLDAGKHNGNIFNVLADSFVNLGSIAGSTSEIVVYSDEVTNVGLLGDSFLWVNKL